MTIFKLRYRAAAVCAVMVLAISICGTGCATTDTAPNGAPNRAESSTADTASNGAANGAADTASNGAANGAESSAADTAPNGAANGAEESPIAQMLRKLTKKPNQSASPKKTSGTWELILVNGNSPLPENFTVDLVEFQAPYRVDKRIYTPAANMFEAAQKAGVSLMVCSAYRSVDSQQRNFNAKVAEWKSYGYSDAQAHANTLEYIALPGTSEHHTGLAIDIVTPSYTALNSGYDGTAAAKWLRENAHRYGFILRFPAGKEHITGIAFEPWHYRYVGEAQAKIIYEKKLCLEEFLKSG